MRRPRVSSLATLTLLSLAALPSSLVACGSSDNVASGGASSSSHAVSTGTMTTTTTGATTSSAGGASSSSTGGGGPGGFAGGIISADPQSKIEAETHVAVAPNGFVCVAWIAIKPMGDSSNGFRFSKDNGATWEPIDELRSPNGEVASDPVLAFDQQNNFYMTWIGFKFDAQGMPFDMHVYAATAPAGTTKFGAPVEVAGGAGQYDKPWIIVTNKNTPVVTYARTSTGGIFAARTTDQGKTWKSSKIVEDMNFRNLVFPCQGAKDTRLFATYHAGGGIGLRWSDDDGVTWPDVNKTAAAMMGEQPAFDDPTCAADGNDVFVSYGLSPDQFNPDSTPALNAIRVAHSKDNGVTIATHVDAHDKAAGKVFLHPQLLRQPSGELHLVYYAGQMDGDKAGSYRHATSQDGATWAPSAAVQDKLLYTKARSSAQWLGDYTGVAWANGFLYTSYVDNITMGMQSHVAIERIASP